MGYEEGGERQHNVVADSAPEVNPASEDNSASEANPAKEVKCTSEANPAKEVNPASEAKVAVTWQNTRLARTQEKQELKSIPANAISHLTKFELKAIKNKIQQISKTASHHTLIRLPNRAYEQFVKWKGSWGKGRAFVVSETGASVKNRGEEKFSISGDKSAVERAINMIATQSPTAVASSNDYDILNEDYWRLGAGPSGATLKLQRSEESKVKKYLLGL